MVKKGFNDSALLWITTTNFAVVLSGTKRLKMVGKPKKKWWGNQKKENGEETRRDDKWECTLLPIV